MHFGAVVCAARQRVRAAAKLSLLAQATKQSGNAGGARDSRLWLRRQLGCGATTGAMTGCLLLRAGGRCLGAAGDADRAADRCGDRLL